MAILDIRGTHGSGKSFVAHSILTLGTKKPIMEDGVHLGYHIAEIDCAVLGKYSNVCGGCDGIGSADEIVRRVRLFAPKYRNVVLEGILVSHTFQRYNDLAVELADYDYRFLFLNTPLRNCIARVVARRFKQGKKKVLDPKNIIKDWHQVWERVRTKCVEAGRNVTILNWENPMPQVQEILCRE
jgi:uridine kinase